jgi:hypothetical protein
MHASLPADRCVGRIALAAAGPYFRRHALQEQALRSKREPETAFADGQAFREQLLAQAAADDDSRARALRRARQE